MLGEGAASPNGTSAADNFRRQHEELIALGLEIMQQLDPRSLASEEAAGVVRRAVARFGGQLLVHAEMENKALYPRLLHHSDDAVRERAQGLSEEVRRYAKRWPTPASIAERAPEFVRETRDVLKLLGKRMLRENDELYPLVDHVS